jgi:tryptophanyl-tRNA synthetase
MNEKDKVTPWEVSDEINYERLIKEFGIKKIEELPEEFKENVLFRRKTIFAQRDFGLILDSIKNKKPFVMMTGLMPTGKLHLGHLILIKQMVFYQKLGAKIYIAVADLEAYNARKMPLGELKENAIEQYLVNYAAEGLNLKKCEIYFQSERSKDSKKSNAYYRLASNFSRYATFNEFKGVYGDISPGKMNASLLQASDMYHPQLPEFEGKPIPTFIPVGVDQDPHIRIARDMGKRNKDHKFIPIASTYHIFMPGLQGPKGKMSSSNPNSYIALTDDPKTVKNKINKYAFSGGQVTVEEHRKKGGNPDIDVSFQYLKFLFEEDDKKLAEIEKKYRSGEMLTGELKQYTIDKINTFLAEHQKKRKKAKKVVEEFMLKK